jgi:hypothetical protein
MWLTACISTVTAKSSSSRRLHGCELTQAPGTAANGEHQREPSYSRCLRNAATALAEPAVASKIIIQQICPGDMHSEDREQARNCRPSHLLFRVGDRPRADRRSDSSARVKAMTDSGKTKSSEPRDAVVSPAADATARGRWKALVLTDPVAKLVRNAVHAGFDEDVYDLRQLALAAIDVVVASMGFAREATLDEVIDTLTGIAGRMQSAEEHADEWRTVAQQVVMGLLNETHEQRRFTYRFADLTDPGVTRWNEYRFRLLSLRDTEYGTVLVASDQAVMLYLDGLDVDIEDAEAALAHVLQRQLDDRRFDAAVHTAAQAERTSVGMSAMLTDLLDATSRDVRSHDWLVDVPDRLTRARRHVEARIGEDDRFLEHVQAGLDGSGAV